MLSQLRLRSVRGRHSSSRCTISGRSAQALELGEEICGKFRVSQILNFSNGVIYPSPQKTLNPQIIMSISTIKNCGELRGGAHREKVAKK